MVVPSPKIRRKTDNHDLTAKLDLRRQVIAQAGIEPLHVLDLFAGLGNIWNSLRAEPRTVHSPKPLDVESYTPVDAVAKQPGQIRAKITPRLIAALNGDPDEVSYKGDGLTRFNVVDIDTYGDPWELWSAILHRIKTKTCVFATRGVVTYGSGKMPITNHAKKVMGIPKTWNVPGRIEILNISDRYCLLEQCPTARISAGWEIKLPRVHYYGLIVEPVLSGQAGESHDNSPADLFS